MLALVRDPTATAATCEVAHRKILKGRAKIIKADGSFTPTVYEELAICVE